MNDSKNADKALHDKALHDIEQLVSDFQRSGMRELHLRTDNVEIYLSADGSAAGINRVESPNTPADTARSQLVPATTPSGTSPVETASPKRASVTTDLPANAVIVPAPYLGSFYRAPKPGAPAYVEIGDQVTAETEVCLMEVMKLFTAVRAGAAGRVHAVYATDGQMVEADQPLFAVIPD